MNKEAVTLLGLILKQKVYSNHSTGLAFAGFGKDEQFPSLHVYDTEGIIANEVKRDLVEKIVISADGQRGHIAALAQDDVVKRYVEGIDPRVSDELGNELRKLIIEFGDELSASWFQGTRAKKARSEARAAADKLLEAFTEEIVSKVKEKERREITDVVHYMSKLELAQLAEALVEMTALRRRVSMQMETVGGPIDVAVISRGDGFVWIKRKHYFDKELNSRYFALQNATLTARRGP